jgi:hypothetical protein
MRRELGALTNKSGKTLFCNFQLHTGTSLFMYWNFKIEYCSFNVNSTPEDLRTPANMYGMQTHNFSEVEFMNVQFR